MNPPRLKIIQTIHLAFCSGIILFSIVIISLNKDNLFFDVNPATSAPFNPIFPVLSIVFSVLGLFLFKKNTSAIDPQKDFDSKISTYQTSFLILCAFLEAGALMNIVACFITHNTFFLIFGAICLLLLIINRPTKDKLISILQLQYPDTELL